MSTSPHEPRPALHAVPRSTAPSNVTPLRQAPPAAKTRSPGFEHRRGDIWIVASDPDHPPVGTEMWSDRPAVVISNNVLNKHSGFAQVVYLSTSARKTTSPVHVPLRSPDRKGGMTMALCEQIHTVDASRLRRKLGYISAEEISELDAAMAVSLSLNTHPDKAGLFRKWERHINSKNIDIQAEIQALSGHTTDQRVESLVRALTHITAERDAWKTLYETRQDLPAEMQTLSELMSSASPESEPSESATE